MEINWVQAVRLIPEGDCKRGFPCGEDAEMAAGVSYASTAGHL